MGPNTNDRNLMKALAENGMDIARFNFSHGDYEEQKSRLDMLKSIRDELDLPIAALLDTGDPYRPVKRREESNLKRGSDLHPDHP